jgi:hypothetical protein
MDLSVVVILCFFQSSLHVVNLRKTSSSMKLATYRHLKPWLRMFGALPSLPHIDPFFFSAGKLPTPAFPTLKKLAIYFSASVMSHSHSPLCTVSW